MRTNFLATQSQTIPANSTIIALCGGGSLFLCKESSAAFKVSFDNDAWNDCEVGLGFRFLGGEGFRSVRLQNPTASDITVTYYVGTAEVIDNRLNTLIERDVTMTSRLPRTQLVGAEVELDPGDSVVMAGTFLNKYRKQIVLTNTHASENLKIRVEDADEIEVNGATLRPLVPWTIETTAEVKILNPATNSNPITLEALGIHYVD